MRWNEVRANRVEVPLVPPGTRCYVQPCMCWSSRVLLPGAATAAAPAEAAGVGGVGGSVSHSVARLEDTGSCFPMYLHLFLTHLHSLWAHGLQREGTAETTVRAAEEEEVCWRINAALSWSITHTNITVEWHEIKHLRARPRRPESSREWISLQRTVKRSRTTVKSCRMQPLKGGSRDAWGQLRCNATSTTHI